MIENTISIDMAETVAPPEGFDMAEAENETAAQERDHHTEEENGSDGVQQSDETADGEQTDKPEAEKITLNVYGQQVEVTLEEAKAAAQKGVAFDRIKNQLAESRNNVHLKALETIAGHRGITVDTLVMETALRNAMADIEEKYGSMDAAPAEVLGENVHRMAQLKQQLADTAAADNKAHWRAQLGDFLRDNPGARDIPMEVIERAKETGSLVLAYSDYQAAQFKAELEKTKSELLVLQGEKEAEKTAVPSAQSIAAAKEYADDSFAKMMRSTW